MPLPILGGTKLADTTFSIDNSCRFNDGDSAYMSKTRSTPTSEKKFTLSAWVKFCTFGTDMAIAGWWRVYSGSSYSYVHFFKNSSDQLEIKVVDSNQTVADKITNRVLRDPSAWYHLLVNADTTDETQEDRIQIYINGTRETSWATNTMTHLNQNINLSPALDDSGTTVSIGASGATSAVHQHHFDGYITEVFHIDGTAYAASTFGEFDEDSPTIWKPKDCKDDVTFGNEGFYLDMEDSGNLGDDEGDNTDDLSETNLAAADQATDTPTNNFCVFNILNPSFTGTNSEGNCKHLSSSSAWRAIYGTIPFTTGKWYAEFKMVADGSSAGPGVINIDMTSAVDTFRLDETNRGLGQGENAVAYLSNAQILDGGNTIKTGQTTWTDNDILGVAIDATNGYVYWHKNGTYMDGATSGTTVGDPTSGSSGTGGYPLADLVAANGTYLFGVGGDDAWHVEANFGGCPAFSISSGNSDGNGYGNFEYAVPSGYYALCTKNLAEYG